MPISEPVKKQSVLSFTIPDKYRKKLGYPKGILYVCIEKGTDGGIKRGLLWCERNRGGGYSKCFLLCLGLWCMYVLLMHVCYFLQLWLLRAPVWCHDQIAWQCGQSKGFSCMLFTFLGSPLVVYSNNREKKIGCR